MNRLVLFLAAASLSFAQSTPTPDDQARFLAGLPPQDGLPLFELAQRAEFVRHAKGLDAAWEDVEKRQLGAIRGWMQETLPQLVADTAPLLYVFSGPDFLHANTFFPNASTYILCGIEPVGTPPDVTKLGGDSLDEMRPRYAALRRAGLPDAALTQRGHVFWPTAEAADGE